MVPRFLDELLVLQNGDFLPLGDGLRTNETMLVQSWFRVALGAPVKPHQI